MSAFMVRSSYLTDAVRGLAARCLTEPAVLSILADALEEAGYGFADPLAEMRAGSHPKDGYGFVERLATYDPVSLAETERRIAAQVAKEAREKKYAAARESLAVTVGKRWHHTVADLYQSKRAEVVYGSGGGEVVDWDAYGKKGYRNPHTGRKQPAKYRNAGARVIGFGRSGRIVLENSRGTEVARLPVPPADAVVGGAACLSGELFTTRRKIAGLVVATRYAPVKVRGKKTEYAYERTGLAVLLPIPPALADHSDVFVPGPNGQRTYWEHGDTVAAIRREYEHKRRIAAERQAADERRRAEAERSAREKAKAERRAALLARIGTRTPVTYADARACGMCDAGIRAFAAKLGIADTAATVPLAEVFKHEPAYALKLARRVIDRRAATRPSGPSASAPVPSRRRRET